MTPTSQASPYLVESVCFTKSKKIYTEGQVQSVERNAGQTEGQSYIWTDGRLRFLAWGGPQQHTSGSPNPKVGVRLGGCA